MRNYVGQETGVLLGRWRLPDLQPGLIERFAFTEVGATFCIGLKSITGSHQLIPALSWHGVQLPRSGVNMPCNRCASDDQQVFSGELTFAFPGVERLNQSPAYVCSKFLVCMSCEYTEIVITPTNLERLKKGMDTCSSPGS